MNQCRWCPSLLCMRVLNANSCSFCKKNARQDGHSLRTCGVLLRVRHPPRRAGAAQLLNLPYVQVAMPSYKQVYVHATWSNRQYSAARCSRTSLVCSSMRSGCPGFKPRSVTVSVCVFSRFLPCPFSSRFSPLAPKQLAHAVEIRPQAARHSVGRHRVLSRPVQRPRSELAAGESFTKSFKSVESCRVGLRPRWLCTSRHAQQENTSTCTYTQFD